MKNAVICWCLWQFQVHILLLDHSAGTIAGMSLENGITIYDLDYDELKAVLSKDGQVLSLDSE